MNKFEVVSKYADKGINIPIRKTAKSAGYDLEAAEDTVIYPYMYHLNCLESYEEALTRKPLGLDTVKELTKENRPTLISTGLKCALDDGYYLELSPRSSTPLKYWLMMANSIGIIDGDYYNNPDNEGEIFLQFINLSPYPIEIKKGEAIGQAIFKKYGVTDDDVVTGERTGGFGSTNE